jgi:nitrogen fixation NifU-like protein
MDIGTGMVGAPAGGDVMKLQIKCEQQGNTHVIKDVKFKTYGCGSAIASSSELVEMLLGKTLEEAKEIKNIDIVDALELPPIKIHCSVLAEDSIKQAIEDYEQKQ